MGRARGRRPRARGFGLLILAGLLVRRVGRDGRFGAELLGSGDIVRPWEHDGETTVPFDTTWRVLAPTRLAVLDLAWARRMAPFPEIAGTLIGRAMERSRRLAVNMAIAQHPCLGALGGAAVAPGRAAGPRAHRRRAPHPPRDPRDAGQPGRRPPPAARRPSVSAALGGLAERGVVRRDGVGWVLLGDPPDDLDGR
ncbi:MAG: hypothetical protein WKF99_06410 [Solirubrobacteraceae bacterium]